MISLRFDDVLDKLLLLVVLACAALTFAGYVRTLVQIVAKRNNDAGLGAQSGPSLIARPTGASFFSGASRVRNYSYKGTALLVVRMTEIAGIAAIVLSLLAAIVFVMIAFRSDWPPAIDLIRCGLIVDLAAGWLIGAGLINAFPTVWVGEEGIVISVYFTRRAAIPWSEVVNVKRWPLLPDGYMVSAKRITPIHKLYRWLGRTSLPSFVILRSIDRSDELIRELGRKIPTEIRAY